MIVRATIRACLKGDFDTAIDKLNDLWAQGYGAVDIIVTIFHVVKTFDEWFATQCLIQLVTECPSMRN